MLLCIHKEFTKYDDIYLLKLINFKRRKVEFYGKDIRMEHLYCFWAVVNVQDDK